MHESFIFCLAVLRIDKFLRVMYSIVTERKQPEIRSEELQGNATFKGIGKGAAASQTNTRKIFQRLPKEVSMETPDDTEGT